MGESVAEATITNWLKKVGDPIEADEAILEIATDKVDSEVPSEVAGVLTEILFQVNDVVKVGQTIAIIETEGVAITPAPVAEAKTESTSTPAVEEVIKTVEVAQAAVAPADFKSSDKFYSPLVKNISTAEGISVAELESISGSGKNGRVTKEDILNYIKNRGTQPNVVQPTTDNRYQTTNNSSCTGFG